MRGVKVLLLQWQCTLYKQQNRSYLSDPGQKFSGWRQASTRNQLCSLSPCWPWTIRFQLRLVVLGFQWHREREWCFNISIMVFNGLASVYLLQMKSVIKVSQENCRKRKKIKARPKHYLFFRVLLEVYGSVGISLSTFLINILIIIISPSKMGFLLDSTPLPKYLPSLKVFLLKEKTTTSNPAFWI